MPLFVDLSDRWELSSGNRLVSQVRIDNEYPRSRLPGVTFDE